MSKVQNQAMWFIDFLLLRVSEVDDLMNHKKHKDKKLIFMRNIGNFKAAPI